MLKSVPLSKTQTGLPSSSFSLSNNKLHSKNLSFSYQTHFIIPTQRHSRNVIVCEQRGPRPRYPRVWKTRKKIGTISKSRKLVDCVKELSNVKEEVYGALDAFIAWELEFPLITVKKALKALEFQKDWKRVIQVSKWMLSKGQGRTLGSYYMLLNALVEEDRLEEAEELWTKILSDNLESTPRMYFAQMISIYDRKGMYDKMFNVFADMEELGVHPNNSTVIKIGLAFKKLGMMDKYEKLNKKYPPPDWVYRFVNGKRVKVPMEQRKWIKGMDIADLIDGTDKSGNDDDMGSFDNDSERFVNGKRGKVPMWKRKWIKGMESMDFANLIDGAVKSGDDDDMGSFDSDSEQQSDGIP